MKFPDWKQLLGRRRGLKAIALLLAILVWYAIGYVTGNEATVTDVPLTVATPPGWIATHADVQRVTVHFRGTRDDLRLLDRESVKATLDLSKDAAPGEREFTLGTAIVNAPGGASAQHVHPEIVHVKLDRQATRAVRVELETLGTLPRGYEPGIPAIFPSSVDVTGPASLVEALDRVPTVPLDLDGRIQPFEGRRLLLAVDKLPPGLELSPPAVTLNLPILEQTLDKPFRNHPVSVLLPPDGAGTALEITPPNVHVTLRGRPEDIRTVNSDDVKVYADFTSDANPGRQTPIELRVQYPAGLSLVSIDPAKVQVHRQDKTAPLPPPPGEEPAEENREGAEP